MNSILKNVLGGLLGLLLLAAGYLGWGFQKAYQQSVDERLSRNFSVSAEAKVTAVPDVAQFTYSVITEGGKDVTALMTDNTTKMNKISDFVKANGVAGKDIITQNYSLDPRYQYSNCKPGESCPPPEIVGYTINQSVLVKARDFKKLGALLSGVVNNGANSVSQFTLTIDDKDAYQKQAREQAMAKAREKAAVIAKSGDFTLGRLIYVSEDAGYVNPTGGFAGDVYSKEGLPSSAPTPNIEPGSQEVRVTVSLNYEIR